MANSNYLTQQAMRPSVRPQTNPYVNQQPAQFYPQNQMNGSSPHTHTAPAYEQQYGPGPQYSQNNMQVRKLFLLV